MGHSVWLVTFSKKMWLFDCSHMPDHLYNCKTHLLTASSLALLPTLCPLETEVLVIQRKSHTILYVAKATIIAYPNVGMVTIHSSVHHSNMRLEYTDHFSTTSHKGGLWMSLEEVTLGTRQHPYKSSHLKTPKGLLNNTST